MESKAKVIHFPGTCRKPSRAVKNVDGIKYFNQHQFKLLRRTVQD